MTLSPSPATQHLNHQQICDLLLATDDLSSFAAGGELALSLSKGSASPISQEDHEAELDHLRQCLTCTSELETLRSSVMGFQAAAAVITQRELARRPLRPPFASLSPSRSRGYAIPGLVWATAALVVAAALPFGLTHNFNPFLGQKAATVASNQHTVNPSAPAAASNSNTQSDEALLESINQDLSASVPSALQPLTSTQTTQASN